MQKKFKKMVILDTIIFYPEHRKILESMAEEIMEYPTSLPEGLEEQYTEHPELFLNKKCYTQLGANNTPLQLLMNRIEGADVVISCWTDIPDEILTLNPQLKLVVFWTHEKEHRINMALADKLGVTVSNVPDYGTDAVAEVVFAGVEELLARNFKSESEFMSAEQIAHAVVHYTFDHFRKLKDNEHNTRKGKFSHHFHKIGKASFNFDEKKLSDLIPEQLIEGKNIGLLNIPESKKACDMLSAFDTHASTYTITDTSLATYYKFLAENDLVFYDPTTIDAKELKRISLLFGYKLIDIQTIPKTAYEIEKKTFGIVGLGRIGKRVAAIATKLGFTVVYHSKTRKTALEESLGIIYKSLEELTEMSDVISINLPAHKAEDLITADLISKMKIGCIFINTADGNALDQKALTARMAKDEIFAYLDVYPGLPRKDILGLPMEDKTDWKIQKELPSHVFAYRSGWKTQESIRVKTYKLLGIMMEHLLKESTVV